MDFLNFTLSALLGPVFAWLLREAASGAAQLTVEHDRTAFQLLLWGVGLAVVLTAVARETGPAARAPVPVAAGAPT